MDDEVSRQIALLRRLTARQRAVFTLLCRRLSRDEIAARLDEEVRVVDSDIAAITEVVAAVDPAYRTLGWVQRRRRLRQLYALVKYLDEEEAAGGAAEEPAEEPVPAAGTPTALARFVADAALVDPPPVTFVRPSMAAGTGARPPRGGFPDPVPRGIRRPVRRRWPALALLLALVAVSGLAGDLIGRGLTPAQLPTSGLAAADAPAPATATAGVVARQPMSTAAASAVVLASASLAAPTPLASATPAPATTPAAPPPAATTTLPASAATPMDLTGKAASDLPGTPLLVGSAVSSVVDRDTKPRDVYAVTLQPGQRLRVALSAASWHYDLFLSDPGVLSVDGGQSLCSLSADCTRTIPIAAAGTYLLVVRADAPGLRYTLRTAAVPLDLAASVANRAGQVASDLPGTPLTPGDAVASVLDQGTKWRDVYALPLRAGQTLQVDVSADQWAYRVFLVPPGTAALGADLSGNRCGLARDCHVTAPIAAAGTYTLVVQADGPWLQYTLRTAAH